TGPARTPGSRRTCPRPAAADRAGAQTPACLAPKPCTLPRPMASLTRAKVEVTGNQVEAALKTLKKVMLKGGLFQEMKRRVYYEKPSGKRQRKQGQARQKRRGGAKGLPARGGGKLEGRGRQGRTRPPRRPPPAPPPPPP